MGITVAHGSPYNIWVPLDAAVTVLVGSIVCIDTTDIANADGVIMRPMADGVANITNYDIPFGVCIGTNELTPNFDTTYKAEKTVAAAAADPHDGSTREYAMVEGPWGRNQWSMVEISVITPSTVLRAPIYNAAVGTAPTLLTATAAVTDGLSATTNSTQFTPVAGLATIYCRTGGNAGIYKRTYNTSKTAHTWYNAMPADIAIGDTFVSVPVVIGLSYVRIGIDAFPGFIDCSQTPATNYDEVVCYRLDLREAGKEYCEFSFLPTAFIPELNHVPYTRATT
jgi:hypothetical protein